MISYLRLIKTVLLHKWYVLKAGLRLNVPLWRLLIHDLSKFSWREFRDYARWFYGDKQNHQGFQRAWLHHQHVNDHHWESWVQLEGEQSYRAVIIGEEDSKNLVLIGGSDLVSLESYPLSIPRVSTVPMPEVCVREMVADWFAAGKAYNGTWPNPADFTWYEKNRARMHLHVDTEMRIGLMLAEAARWRW